jgi:hypothetical protein
MPGADDNRLPLMNVFHWLIGHISNRRKALSLYQRGMTKAKKHDEQGAIVDYTATIESPHAPADVRAMALFNRALVYAAAAENAKATEDLDVVLAMPAAPTNIKTEARRKLLRMHRRSSSSHA